MLETVIFGVEALTEMLIDKYKLTPGLGLIKSFEVNKQSSIGVLFVWFSNFCFSFWGCKLEAQVDQKSLTWIRLIMICYIVPWWPSWLSDQITFSNSKSDVI